MSRSSAFRFPLLLSLRYFGAGVGVAGTSSTGRDAPSGLEVDGPYIRARDCEMVV